MEETESGATEGDSEAFAWVNSLVLGGLIVLPYFAYVEWGHSFENAVLFYLLIIAWKVWTYE